MLIKLGAGSGYFIFFLFCRVKPHNFTGKFAALHFNIRSDDKTVFVNSREVGEVTYQTNVLTFGRLNRTYLGVIRFVHVTDFNARTFLSKTPGPQGSKPSFMLNFG